MALRRVFRAFVCAYRGMDGKFHRAKKPFVVFWSYFTGVLVGRDDVHGVVLGRDGTRSVRRVRRARQRRGKSDVRLVCVGQVFVRIVPCAVFRGKKSSFGTCHNDCHFGVNVDFLYFYSAIPRGETCKSRRSRPAFMVFVSVVAVLRSRDYKLKKGRRRPPSRKNGALCIICTRRHRRIRSSNTKSQATARSRTLRRRIRNRRCNRRRIRHSSKEG